MSKNTQKTTKNFFVLPQLGNQLIAWLLVLVRSGSSYRDDLFHILNEIKYHCFLVMRLKDNIFELWNCTNEIYKSGCTTSEGCPLEWDGK